MLPHSACLGCQSRSWPSCQCRLLRPQPLWLPGTQELHCRFLVTCVPHLDSKPTHLAARLPSMVPSQGSFGSPNHPLPQLEVCLSLGSLERQRGPFSLYSLPPHFFLGGREGFKKVKVGKKHGGGRNVKAKITAGEFKGHVPTTHKPRHPKQFFSPAGEEVTVPSHSAVSPPSLRSLCLQSGSCPHSQKATLSSSLLPPH